jgi:hypothetical protein
MVMDASTLRTDIAQLRREVVALRAEVDRIGAPRVKPRRLRRQSLLAGLVALALAIPAITVASHEFGDVPTNGTFHANITNISRAGITVGCSPGLYCPADPVRRDQMAAFLNRGLGRASRGDAAGVQFVAGFVTAAQVDLATPGAGFVLVTAHAMAYPASPGCPCRVRLELLGPLGSGDSYYLETPVLSGSFGHVGNTWLFEVAGKGTHTFKAMIIRSGGTATMRADTVITALWAPFDGAGNGALGGALAAPAQPTP